MATFWDTSALLPLIYREVHTPRAVAAAARPGPYLAWEWLRIEARLAMARRGDDRDRLARLDEWMAGAGWHLFERDSLEPILTLGLRHGLRASDAGHLYALLQVRRLFPAIVFVCFDCELASAATREGVAVFDHAREG